MKCAHSAVQCVNDFELVPKYRCEICDAILICECERALSARLMPHQVRRAAVAGHERVVVNGYAAGICPFCRDQPLAPAPKAAIGKAKGKVERYYWREIKRTYFAEIIAWLDASGLQALGLREFQAQFPAEAKQLQVKARDLWKTTHGTDPRYNIDDEDQQEFLARCRVSVEEVRAEYQKVPGPKGHELGRWRSPSGELVRAEEFALRHFVTWTGFHCERRLMSTLYAVLLSPAIQDPSDPKILHTVRNSTLGWSRHNPHTRQIRLSLPADFGTPTYFQRRQTELEVGLDEIKGTTSLSALFEERLQRSAPMRDYLSAHDDAVAVARAAIQVIPQTALATMLDWVARAFWERIRGWPDLLLLRTGEYRFLEVKGPEDRLSQPQMRWFEWAASTGIPASICQLRRR